MNNEEITLIFKYDDNKNYGDENNCNIYDNKKE